MIIGMHMIIYSSDAEADRAFFRDVLGFPSVDAGKGWLIFAAPPSKIACQAADGNDMCDDVRAEIARLRGKGIKCGSVSTERWGLVTTVLLPGSGQLGLYEPRDATPRG